MRACVRVWSVSVRASVECERACVRVWSVCVRASVECERACVRACVCERLAYGMCACMCVRVRSFARVSARVIPAGSGESYVCVRLSNSTRRA